MENIALAIIKLTIIAVLGYYLYRKNIIDQKVLNFLIFFVINFTIPFLAFSHIVEHLKIGTVPSLGIFLSLSVLIFITGFGFGWLFSFKKSSELRREFISIVSFQNCGYLPLNIALYLFPARLREEFIIFTFLYILGFDIIMWSVGSFFIFRKKDEGFKFKSMLTPPIIATILSLILVYTNTAQYIPSMLLVPLKMTGDTSFVLSMLILGCWLARVDLKGFYGKLPIIIEASLLKLVAVPIVFLFLTSRLGISSLFGFFIVLQASMPSAVSLPIVVNLRNADSEFVSQGVLFTHIFSIFTVPLWLGLYLKLSGFSF